MPLLIDSRQSKASAWLHPLIRSPRYVLRTGSSLEAALGVARLLYIVRQQ